MSNVRMTSIQNWYFKTAGANDWKLATVPGCVHTDLLKHEMIPDPFVGENELDLQWVDKQDWEYKTTISLSAEWLQEERVELIFEGLDTYADVYVNGEKVLQADNMFRSWKVDVKSYLKIGENQLLVYFHSPINHDIDKPDQLGYNLPADNDHSEDGGVGQQKLSVFARKAPYHYGWDWGPRFVTSGIWKGVYLEAWSGAKLTDFHIQQQAVSSEKAEINAVLEIEATKEIEVAIVISDQHDLNIKKACKLAKGSQVIEIPILIENPQLWWSNGLGKPYLYCFQADLKLNERIKHTSVVKTGLRSISLVREDDQHGQSFYFELNGVPIFAKGANHIPNDSFQTRTTREEYEHDIATAAASNMNMLRVWGGGIYEYDMFYELCDEYGILVWQDFMFACSMYPGDSSFMNSVKKEAIDNVKRLRNYACIALWCGNNEMDAAWSQYEEKAGWGWKQRYNASQRKKIWKAYDEVFHHLLPSIVEEYDPNTDYWPSSPMRELSHDKNQHATFDTVEKGDIHYWDVWHGLKPIEAYKEKVGRFMSEYGFQSFPEKKTVLTYAKEEELALESDVMLHHQKNGAGNRLIKNYMEMYYKKPKDFPSFLHLSHILQADAIRSAVEAHRLNMPYCMGTLYWQLNDCWPVASWSSMDYYGRWKALQYVIKNRFKTTALIVDQKDDSLSVYVVSDQLQDQEVQLSLHIYDLNGQPIFQETQAVFVRQNTSTVIYETDIQSLGIAEESNNIVLFAQLTVNGNVIDSVEHVMVKPKDLVLQDPQIQLTYVDGGIELESQSFAMNVWLETDKEGCFEDNNFSLIPGIKKYITYTDSVRRNIHFTKTQEITNVNVSSMYDYIVQ
ncbi:glycoside hydrolase family 2 protein [Gracilibacillus salitolerans]|uniref:Beta-mannosidase B n=1 Tax=Gracilibacillus salitolerans TaxID=2663022 RepID=A0A5Q2TR99_9BACI|nr:glycoside hydrolase family 2 protein [Gracilibacillus salitolerans]QGH36622.1 glycoside hydrolase family 2 protein [Gracilibacillus salitolerans]